MAAIVYQPIGIIHTPFADPEGMPIQPAGADGVAGTVTVFPDYREGLQDLDGFSHIILLYHFHRSRGFRLDVVPFLDTVPRGVFATRAPRRPNPIGLSIVRLLGIDDVGIHVANVDIIDGTPLLDIKPYVPSFDAQSDVRCGWLDKTQDETANRRSDDRFNR